MILLLESHCAQNYHITGHCVTDAGWKHAGLTARINDTFITVQKVMRMRPQSGQTQVGPLLMPHRFSLKHFSQI